ncbi:MAG: nucleoside transporter [Deltaproteobacteria bacterium]|nr:nucleoside transporter [Deltaproteobacteria bacterium]MBF0525410.1 nucleoside transporter [Deltaproteobacteria bacterium]
MELYNLVSFFGMFALLGIAWLMSAHKRTMNWWVIICGTCLQLIFGLFIFVLPGGPELFLWLNQVVIKVLNCATAGTQFLFGRLALPPGETDASGQTSVGFILAFQALPTMIFFGALMAGLYYLKIMPVIVKGFAQVFSRVMRISGAESLSVSSNRFVGVEAYLAIKPYLDGMTRSELHTILAAGMATIASNVLAFYVFMLQHVFPAVAGHLISATIISAPAAVVISKIIIPETGKPATLGIDIEPYHPDDANFIDSLINGSNAGLQLVIGIMALLISFLGMLSLLDLILGGVGGWVNSLVGSNFIWSFKNILGYIFYPFCLIIGIPPEDAMTAAKLIGERLIVTEVAAYQDLAVLMKNHAFVHHRSIVVTTYALCGFAHVASMAIFVGGLAALAPKRRSELAALGPRALLSATLACLLTGAVAGTFYTSKSILLSR